MGKKNVVLDDDLYKEYHAYKNSTDGKGFSKDKISKILRFSGNEVLTNQKQWERLSLDLKTPLGVSISKMADKNASLEDLALKTNYKIILTDDKAKDKFPYVNIDGDEIDVVLGGFVMKNKPRDKAIKHLTALCRDARNITVYDKYFSKEGRITGNVDTLTAILPNARVLNIKYHKDTSGEPPHISDDCKTAISAKGITWNFIDAVLPEHHDRYLVIDDKLEIILTSGFDNLGNIDKEITYIVRDCSNSKRF